MREVGLGLVTLAIGFAGGGLFYWLHAPLPWTLGSLAATAVAAVAFRQFVVSTGVRSYVRPIVGVLAGSAFTPSIAASIVHWWDAILFVCLFAAMSSSVGYVYLRYACRRDPVTAFFGSTPAGLGELTLIGGSLGGNMRELALIHAVRIVAVVFAVPIILQMVVGHPISRPPLTTSEPLQFQPFDVTILMLCALGGVVIAKIRRIPLNSMIAAMLLSAAFHASGVTDAKLPPLLVVVVQIVIGAVAGSRFAGITVRELRSTALVAISWAAILCLMAGGAALLASWVLERPFAVALLALAPGGMLEMTILTLSLGIEVALVVTCQVVRSFVVLTIAPILYAALNPSTAADP